MIRDITPADFDAVLALNAESVEVLSPLDSSRLARLYDWAAYRRGIENNGELVAFLLAFREGLGYDSPNYQWFCRSRKEFLYIDRIVVRPDQRGQHCGTKLYHDLIAFAEREGCSRLVCEFDVVPLNEASKVFHERLGFQEVGSQWLYGGAKKVSLRELQLSAIDGD